MRFRLPAAFHINFQVAPKPKGCLKTIPPQQPNNQETPMTFAYFSILIFALFNSLCSLLAKKSARLLDAEANREPRRHRAQASGKAARLFAAEQNGYEMLPLYAAAVIIAHATGEAAQSTVNILSAVFLLLRVAYIWAYAQDKAALRSNIWYGCLMCIVALFIAAC